jgi:MoaA/NifB/PqqE/SkfB family radical SAM enzyme
MFRADLEQIVRYATQRGFPAVLAPCGRFASAERLAALKAAGIRAISLSVDGPDAATHDAFRGVSGAFQMALDAMQAAREVGLPFQVNHTLTRAGLGKLRAMRDFALAQGASRLDVFFLVPVGRGSAISAQCLTDAETEAALTELLALDDEGLLPIHVTCEPRILSLAEARETPTRSPCNGCMAGAGFLFLSHIGDLQPCGFFECPLGNIRDFDLDLPQTLAASPRYAALKGGHTCLARASFKG